MKKLVKNEILKLAGVLVFCAGIAIVVATCNEDEDCKKCEHKTIENRTATFCGDELKEAQRSDSDWKNCK